MKIIAILLLAFLSSCGGSGYQVTEQDLVKAFELGAYAAGRALEVSAQK